MVILQFLDPGQVLGFGETLLVGLKQNCSLRRPMPQGGWWCVSPAMPETNHHLESSLFSAGTLAWIGNKSCSFCTEQLKQANEFPRRHMLQELFLLDSPSSGTITCVFDTREMLFDGFGSGLFLKERCVQVWFKLGSSVAGTNRHWMPERCFWSLQACSFSKLLHGVFDKNQIDGFLYAKLLPVGIHTQGFVQLHLAMSRAVKHLSPERSHVS